MQSGADNGPKKWGELTKGADAKRKGKKGSKEHETIRAELPGDVAVTDIT